MDYLEYNRKVLNNDNKKSYRKDFCFAGIFLRIYVAVCYDSLSNMLSLQKLKLEKVGNLSNL